MGHDSCLDLTLLRFVFSVYNLQTCSPMHVIATTFGCHTAWRSLRALKTFRTFRRNGPCNFDAAFQRRRSRLIPIDIRRDTAPPSRIDFVRPYPAGVLLASAGRLRRAKAVDGHGWERRDPPPGRAVGGAPSHAHRQPSSGGGARRRPEGPRGRQRDMRAFRTDRSVGRTHISRMHTNRQPAVAIKEWKIIGGPTLELMMGDMTHDAADCAKSPTLVPRTVPLRRLSSDAAAPFLRHAADHQL